ncbi:replication initiation regulator SeqA [Alishewanella longhuensis]
MSPEITTKTNRDNQENLASKDAAVPTDAKAVKESKVGNIFDLVTPADLQTEQNIVGRFLYLLSVLARVHKKQFHKVLDIKGRNGLFFGNSAAELNETGTSTNPKQIPNTEFWVITNSNTTRKKMMLTETAIKLGYSAEDAERIRDLL